MDGNSAVNPSRCMFHPTCSISVFLLTWTLWSALSHCSVMRTGARSAGESTSRTSRKTADWVAGDWTRIWSSSGARRSWWGLMATLIHHETKHFCVRIFLLPGSVINCPTFVAVFLFSLYFNVSKMGTLQAFHSISVTSCLNRKCLLYIRDSS